MGSGISKTLCPGRSVTSSSHNSEQKDSKVFEGNRDRFQRALKILREHSTPDNEHNAEFRLKRKQQLASIAAEAVQLEKENEIKQELSYTQRMFFSMINYELSSDDDSSDEEIHDIYSSQSNCEVAEGCEDQSISLQQKATDSLSDCNSQRDIIEHVAHFKEAGAHDNSYSTKAFVENDNWLAMDQCRQPERVTAQSDKDGLSTLDSRPRLTSISQNQATVKNIRQNHKLHLIMRQESLEVRRDRARRRLEIRKNRLISHLKGNVEDDDDKIVADDDDILDKETFEDKKNIIYVSNK